jgi:uncharacterized cupin superfamily protein
MEYVAPTQEKFRKGRTVMSREARSTDDGHGRSPTTDGWFVVHASEARWLKSERFGVICNFEGDVPFSEIGLNIHVIEKGQPSCLYHTENAQEDFFVLTGECLLLIEGEERRLRAGHFVHCPPWTEHVFVGTGDDPCAILMVGARPPDHQLLYPVNQLAAGHGASVGTETTSPREAYGSVPLFAESTDPLWPL